MAVIEKVGAGQLPTDHALARSMEADPAPSSRSPLDGDAFTGDMAARDARVRQMVDQHFDLVWRSLRRLGVREGSLDDAAQQVFIVAARKLDTIVVGGERPYLLGIAVRVASDARRTVTRRREVSDEESSALEVDRSPAADELVDQKRARAMLDRILASMPMDLRAAFTMFEIEEMSVPEIAAALSIPLGTAASRLRRAREAFRAALDELRIHDGRATKEAGDA
jgi:RNA polymerase sigma-70 factor (ECF subfamily)